MGDSTSLKENVWDEILCGYRKFFLKFYFSNRSFMLFVGVELTPLVEQRSPDGGGRGYSQKNLGRDV